MRYQCLHQGICTKKVGKGSVETAYQMGMAVRHLRALPYRWKNQMRKGDVVGKGKGMRWLHKNKKGGLRKNFKKSSSKNHQSMTALPVLSILSFRGNIIFQCPRCHSTVGGFERKKYCRYCGQKLRY